MGLKIFWAEFSENELKKIYDYYRERAGTRIAKKLINGIYNETQNLISHPKTGQVEEFLKDRKEEFRYLVFKSYKIIYWINYQENQIEIIDVFDTRQNPVKMKRNE